MATAAWVRICEFRRENPARLKWWLETETGRFVDSASEIGGERGIRTPGTLSDSTVFKTAALNHSAISPACGSALHYAQSPRWNLNLLPRDHLDAIHKGTQRPRHNDRAVLLLIILENGNQCAAHGQA